MNEMTTAGAGGIPANYQRARTISTQGRVPSDTSAGVRSPGTTVVVPSGHTVQMRVVPRLPRQSGDAARTD